jgi:hypothetical protein
MIIPADAPTQGHLRAHGYRIRSVNEGMLALHLDRAPLEKQQEKEAKGNAFIVSRADAMYLLFLKEALTKAISTGKDES